MTIKFLLNYLFLALFVIFPLGQFQKIPLANPQVGFYVQDIIIFLIVFFWLTFKLIKKERIKLKRFGKYIIAFWLALLVSFAVNCFGKPFYEIATAGLYLSRLIVYSSLYFVIANEKIFPFEISIVALLVYSGLACAVLGLGQYLLFPDIRPLTVYQWDPHYYRVVGTFLEPGFLGLLLVLSIILIVVDIWPFKLSKEKIIGYLLLVTCYLSFALTYSRSAYLSYLTAIVFLGWFKKSFKFTAIVLSVFVITVLLLPRPAGEGVRLERDSTIKSRLQNWNQALIVASKKPIFGAGFNFYRYSARDKGFLGKEKWQYSHAGAGVDNSFLFVLATGGLVGFLAFLVLFFKIFEISFSKIPQKKYLLIFLTTVAICVHSFFNNSFFYPWVMIWFWILLGATEYS